MRFEDILARFPDAKRNGQGWMSKCPAHKDQKPSLSIAKGHNGATLLKCMAGCDTAAVCSAVGITLADLFADKSVPRKGAFNIVAVYKYCDENGQLLYEVCRLDPKDFRQRRPDPTSKGGFTWKTAGVRRVPFRLPELLGAVAAGQPIFICEGEKDVLAVVESGFPATCNPGGAGKWPRNFANFFKGAEVIVIADKDASGRAHAQQVAENLHAVAACVRVIELPDVEGRPVKDAADYLGAGGQAAELDELAQAAPLWKPASFIQPSTVVAGSEDAIVADVRGRIIRWLTSKDPVNKVRSEVGKLVVEALATRGQFYFHRELRDFESAMYFDSDRKQLHKICSDSFVARISGWVNINRADPLFKFILAAIETTALDAPHTTSILPESFWAARPGAIYLSNGDGQSTRITAGKVEVVDNGADGVLFAAGKTLAPWKQTSPRDVFETCRLFRDVHCTAPHGRFLFQLWIYSLATNPASKPPACFAGDIGSGKTRTVKGISEFLGLLFVAQKVTEDGEDDFWPSINEGGLLCLDNADTKCRWLQDALANAATGGSSQRRRLYTNSETVTLRANSWLAITTAIPTFASDPGLADRLLVIRMGRTGGDTSDKALSDEIAVNRDAGLSHIAETLSRALADTAPTPGTINFRHPDFAAFAIRIGRALGHEPEAIAALRAAEADKTDFLIENDPVSASLLAHLRQEGRFEGTAAQLVPHLITINGDLGDWLTAQRLGKRLTSIWPHLQAALANCQKRPDRTGLLHFEFEARAGMVEE